jgi:hypothetical protein
MKDIKSKKTKWASEKRRRAVDLGPVELMSLVDSSFATGQSPYGIAGRCLKISVGGSIGA